MEHIFSEPVVQQYDVSSAGDDSKEGIIYPL